MQRAGVVILIPWSASVFAQNFDVAIIRSQAPDDHGIYVRPPNRLQFTAKDTVYQCTNRVAEVDMATNRTLSKQAGVNAHTRAAQIGNTVDVNENEYTIATTADKLAAVSMLPRWRNA